MVLGLRRRIRAGFSTGSIAPTTRGLIPRRARALGYPSAHGLSSPIEDGSKFGARSATVQHSRSCCLSPRQPCNEVSSLLGTAPHSVDDYLGSTTLRIHSWPPKPNLTVCYSGSKDETDRKFFR